MTVCCFSCYHQMCLRAPQASVAIQHRWNITTLHFCFLGSAWWKCLKTAREKEWQRFSYKANTSSTAVLDATARQMRTPAGCSFTFPPNDSSSSAALSYHFIIFFLFCITTRHSRSLTLSFLFMLTFFQLPPSMHPPSVSLPPPPTLSLCPFLTQSSGCTGLHLHSSGGSWSCRRACLCSCCGCCALCSRWAPYQTGKAERTHSASGTVARREKNRDILVWM